MADATRVRQIATAWRASRDRGDPVPLGALCGGDAALLAAVEAAVAAEGTATASPPEVADATCTALLDSTRTAKGSPTVTADGDGDPGTATLEGVRALEALRGLADPIPPAVEPPPGFVLEGELGVGGMGVVYLARQTGLNRRVALKLVKGGAAVDAKSLIRFLAEAEAVAAVKHPNVVEVYQYGEHHGRPYLALEYCPGGDLTSLVSREATPSTPKDAAWFRKVAELMAQVADGVNAAHALGIVHRDLKPHNVFLAADGTPKVADFGLAKRGVGSDLTNTQAVMGTPAYMSPEQAGGGTKFVGPETDVWALGVMLYELCCGERPIDTTGPLLDAIARVANPSVPSLQTKLPAVPLDLSLITHKCLSAEPRDRYPTAGGLATDLRNWLDGKPISARRAGTCEQAVKWVKRNRRLAAMGAAVLLTMATATAVSLGFGLDANAQRREALKEKTNAEEAAGRADREVERTQRTLAKALLAPIVIDDPRHELGDYEQNALWELAAARGGPVPLMIFDRATADELTAYQFQHRAAHLYHAAVGLSSQTRRAADELLVGKAKGSPSSALHSRTVALALVDVEGFGEPSTLADALVAQLRRTSKPDPRHQLTQGIVKVTRRLPTRKATEVRGSAADEVIASLTATPAPRRAVEGLASLTRGLPSDRAAEVCGAAADALVARSPKSKDDKERLEVAEALVELADHLPADRAAELLTAELARIKDLDAQRALAGGLVAVAERLPTESAAEVRGRVAKLLNEAFPAATVDRDGQDLVRGLVAVMSRLPPHQAADLLNTHLSKATRGDVRRSVAGGLVAAAERLPADEATELLAAALKRKPEFEVRQTLVVGLAAAAGRLPTAEAAKVCGGVVGELSAILPKATARGERVALIRSLVAASGHLPADQAAELLVAELGQTQDRNERTTLVAGLASVADRLPPDRAAVVCGYAADLLAAALAESADLDDRWSLAEDLSTVARKLPDDRAATVCSAAADLLVTELARTQDRHSQGTLAAALAAVAARLPQSRAADLCGRVASLLLAEFGDVTPSDHVAVLQGFAAVVGRLPADRAVEVLTTALDVAVTSNQRYMLGMELAAVAVRLPTDRCLALSARAADVMLSASTQLGYYPEGSTDDVLARVVAGLSEPDYVRFKLAREMAVLAGVISLHPAVLPEPRPLPPQQLVELLKHPFCVNGPRRAVLDALEFAYDRQFADLWEFVAFAEKHTDLDLLTPPKRPERK